MAVEKAPAISLDDAKSNSAVDVELVEVAIRLRQELEDLGAARPRGYRLAHPLDSKAPQSTQQSRTRAISQQQ